MAQHGYRSKRWFSVLCILFALFVVITARGDIWAASTTSTYYGVVVARDPAVTGFSYAPTVLNDNGLYKMWYGGTYTGMPLGYNDRIRYRESTDGDNWGAATLAIEPTHTNPTARDSRSTNDPSVVIKTSVAPRSTATASSYHSASWVPTRAIDGNLYTCWSSVYHATATGTEWIELSFGATIGVNAIQLTPRSGGQGFPIDFKLQYYDGSWHDISGQSYTNYTNPGSTVQEFKFPTVKGSKVRLYATKLGVDSGSSHYCQIAEFNATQAKFHMYYTADDQVSGNICPGIAGRYNAIFLATSDDGKVWSKYPNNTNPTPVIDMPGFNFKSLADFENGVDANWSFYRGQSYNGPAESMNYAWDNPYTSEYAHDDLNYWDAWDDSDGTMGYLDARYTLPVADRNLSNYNYLQIHWSGWTTRGTAAKVRVYMRTTGGTYYSLGTHELSNTNDPDSMVELDISGFARTSIDHIMFRSIQYDFSDLSTPTNRQRVHIYYIRACSLPITYGVGMGSVLIKDGYFWQFFNDLSISPTGLFLARSSDGINWTRQNSGNPVHYGIGLDVKYIESLNKYYMAYGNVDVALYWNISSSMTSWPAHSAARTINGPANKVTHNIGLLGDGRGYMNQTSKCYYGAGDGPNGIEDAVPCDIAMSNITVYP